MDDKEIAIIGIVVIFVAIIGAMAVAPKDVAELLVSKLSPVLYTLAGGLAGIVTGRKMEK